MAEVFVKVTTLPDTIVPTCRSYTIRWSCLEGAVTFMFFFGSCVCARECFDLWYTRLHLTLKVPSMMMMKTVSCSWRGRLYNVRSKTPTWTSREPQRQRSTFPSVFNGLFWLVCSRLDLVAMPGVRTRAWPLLVRLCATGLFIY